MLQSPFRATLAGLVSLAVPLLVGCRPPGPSGYENPAVRGIKIISREEADATHLTTEPFEHRGSASDQDGTQLLVTFLEAARARGAIAVSELEVLIGTRLEGKPAICATLVGPEEEVRQRTRLVSTPGRYDRNMVLKPVQRHVTEYEYRCKPVQEFVTRYETQYESSYDYTTKRTQTRPVTRPVSRYETKTKCGSEPVSRYVTRYEYQWESRWIPPKSEMLTEQYSEWKISESEPECAPARPDDGIDERTKLVRGRIHRATP